MNKTARSLVFVVVASCVVLFVLLPRHELLDTRAEGHPGRLLRRQGLPTTAPAGGNTGGNTGNGGGATPTQSSTQPANTPTSTSPPSTSNTPAATTSTTQTTATTQGTTAQTPTSTPQTTTAPATTEGSSSSNAPATSSPNNPPTTSVAGTQTFTDTESSSPASSTSAAASSSTSGTSSGSSLSTGSIIGMSVAGGVAVICVVAFLVWKFTRKRFSDFEDNEAIKWPELNSHGGESISGHALPTHATGRAGFGDDGESIVQGGYASSLATTSTPELYPNATPDPYAVPPLPHLNPNQPYHDEPSGYEHDPNAFYDPYRGPVPNTFNEAGLEAHPVQAGYGAEAIPMTQMARTRSPGPQMGYEMGRQSPQPGRQSPGPQVALGRQSPGPSLSYGNQMMESPGRLPSPGPHSAYGGR